MSIKSRFLNLWSKRRGKVCVIAVGLLLILVIAAVLGWLYLTKCTLGLFDYNNPYHMPGAPVPGTVRELQRDGQKYEYNDDVFSVLLLGVDETVKVEGENTPNQADTIILLTINKKSGQIDMLPIPRDTIVPIMHYSVDGEYAYTQAGPICTAHSFGTDRTMGGQLMSATVSYLFYNIPVNRFISVNLDAISHATDAVGGVPVQVYDDFQEIAGVEPGEWYTLDGEMAELYVRARSLTLMDGSNLSRMVRQREFLFALLGVVKEQTKENLLFPFQLYRELSPYIETDLSFHEMVFCGNLGLQNSNSINLHLMEGDIIEGEVAEVEYAVDEEFLQNYILETYYTPS